MTVFQVRLEAHEEACIMKNSLNGAICVSWFNFPRVASSFQGAASALTKQLEAICWVVLKPTAACSAIYTLLCSLCTVILAQVLWPDHYNIYPPSDLWWRSNDVCWDFWMMGETYLPISYMIVDKSWEIVPGSFEWNVSTLIHSPIRSGQQCNVGGSSKIFMNLYINRGLGMAIVTVGPLRMFGEKAGWPNFSTFRSV